MIKEKEQELRSAEDEEKVDKKSEDAKEDVKEEDNKEVEKKEDPKAEDKEKEEKSEGNPDDKKEEKSEDNPDDKKEEKSEGNPEDEDKQEKEDDKEDRSNDKNKNIEVKKMVEKRFSLIDAINDVANNRPLDNIASKVNEIGTQEMRSTGLSFGGQIQIPTSELRAAVTVAAEGEDVVATDLYDIVGPLRAKNVLVQAGADFLTGLVGDVQIPIMSATNVNWAGETAGAADGAPEFTNVTLSPKRLTAYVEISKQLLAQHSVAVENKIREDIIKAINSKLEATILGSSAGSTTQPAGIFYDATPTVITGIDGIAEVEGDVEEANVFGDNLKWIINPKFKAALRGMAKGQNIAQSLYENGEIDGTPALSTSNVGTKLGVYGDFGSLAIGQWGSIDLTVDPYTQAKNGKIVLVINAFFDAKVVRPEAFGFATTATE
jgi:HK97 family phage major capsid protein